MNSLNKSHISEFEFKGVKGAQGAKGDKGQAASSGVKYVRWGKTSCPNGAQIVYKGKKGR